MPTAADYDSIGIGLPREWVTFPLDDAGFLRMVDGLRDEWRLHDNWDRTVERRCELLLARVRADLRASGARAAGMFVEIPESDDDPVLLAGFTFGIHTRRDLDTTLPLTLGNLATAMAAPQRRGGPRTPLPDGTTSTDLEAPAVHALPCGHAVRLRRLCEVRRDATEQTGKYYAESYVVPIGDDQNACGVLQFVTTNVDLSAPFSDLFVAIAETLNLWTPDDETGYRPPPVDGR